MNPMITGAFIASAAMPATYFLIARFCPLRDIPDLNEAEVKALHRAYRKWDAAFNLLFLTLTGLYGCILWGAILLGADWYGRSLGGDAVLMMTRRYWWFPALLLALSAAGYTTARASRHFLRQRFAEYALSQSLRQNVDYVPFIRLFKAAVAALGLLLLAAGLYAHAMIRGDYIAVRSLFSPEEVYYPIRQIARIRSAPVFIESNGEQENSREYLISFTGGYLWSTRYMGTEAAKLNFIRLVSHDSHTAIEQSSYFEKDELP